MQLNPPLAGSWIFGLRVGVYKRLGWVLGVLGSGSGLGCWRLGFGAVVITTGGVARPIASSGSAKGILRL